MIEEGLAKGHDVHIDSEFVQNLVQYDQATYSERGIKVRLGHPSASDDTMGKQMGYMRNFRTRRQNGKMQAIADLHLLDAADSSPVAPNMRQWALKMASEAPDFIMSSIVFKGSGFYQKKANGHKRPLSQEMEADAELGPVYISFTPEDGAEHYYTDMVEAGAATNSLFSTEANPHFFVSQAHAWLDQHPELLQFIQKNPEAVQAFLLRAGLSASPEVKQKRTMWSIKQWLFGETDVAPEEPVQTELTMLKSELSEAREAVQQLRQERDEFEQKFTAAQQEAERLRTETIALKAEAEDLKTRLLALEARVQKVEDSPAAQPTGGDAGAEDHAAGRSFERRPLYQRALGYGRKK